MCSRRGRVGLKSLGAWHFERGAPNVAGAVQTSSSTALTPTKCSRGRDLGSRGDFAGLRRRRPGTPVWHNPGGESRRGASSCPRPSETWLAVVVIEVAGAISVVTPGFLCMPDMISSRTHWPMCLSRILENLADSFVRASFVQHTHCTAHVHVEELVACRPSAQIVSPASKERIQQTNHRLAHLVSALALPGSACTDHVNVEELVACRLVVQTVSPAGEGIFQQMHR